MQLLYQFEIVGGPYDGTPGLRWMDDGDHPPPDVILLGTCGKGRSCGVTGCSPARIHSSFWTRDEKDRPASTVEYSKQREFVERGDDGELLGRVTYAIGGLLEPGNFGEAARAGRSIAQLGHAAKRGPLVTAGAGEVFARPVDPREGDEWQRIGTSSRCRCRLVSVSEATRLGLLDGRHERGWPR